jgi:hypothetical protein
MKQKIKVLFVAVFILVFYPTRHSALAENDVYEEKSWYYKIRDWNDSDDHYGSYLKPVNNPTYEAKCGECHFPYQPELLPSASWMRILDRLNDHFGEEVKVGPASLIIISYYLKSNGAEYSQAELSLKIMLSLGSHVPMRITDTPYIRAKHHELNPGFLKRESIGSLSNCIACHTSAEKGIYEDDYFKMPQ